MDSFTDQKLICDNKNFILQLSVWILQVIVPKYSITEYTVFNESGNCVSRILFVVQIFDI